MKILDNLNKIIFFNIVLSLVMLISAKGQAENLPESMTDSSSSETHAAISSESKLSKPLPSLAASSYRLQKSLAEIAIELINPVSSLQSLTSEFFYQPYQGELPDADQQTLRSISFTASFPFHLSNGKNIAFRFTVPINLGLPTYTFPGDDRDFTDWRIRQEASSISFNGDFADVHAHMYDISYDLAYGGVSDNGLITMLGMAGVLPTSEDGSGASHLYLLGPEIAVGKKFEGGIVGGWLKQLTKVLATSADRDHSANLTELKLFFAYEIGNGWQILSNSNITYDWEGDKDNKLMLPLGGGIAKTTRIGSLPVRFVVEAQKYLETPKTFGPDWLLKFSMTVVDLQHSSF